MVEVSINKIDFYPVPHTFKCRTGENLIYVRTAATPNSPPGKLYEYIVEVGDDGILKMPNPRYVSLTYDIDGTTITLNTQPWGEVSLDGGTWHPSGYEYDGVVGPNKVYIRAKETDEYSPGVPISRVIMINKRFNPEIPDLGEVEANVIFNTTDIAITGDTRYEVSIKDRGVFVPLPCTLSGEVGMNDLLFRVKETDEFMPGQTVEMQVEVPKLIRHALPSHIKSSNDLLDITILPNHEDVEFSIDGEEWFSEEFNYEGYVGENPIHVRLKETDRYQLSEAIIVNHNVARLPNESEPPVFDAVVWASHELYEITVEPEEEYIDTPIELKVGDEWVLIPHTFTGVIGLNTIELRYAATDTYEASESVTAQYPIPRFDREGPEAHLITITNDRELITVDSDDPDIVIVMPTGDTAWPPATFMGEVGDNIVKVQYRGTEVYNPSSITEILYVIPKLERLQDPHRGMISISNVKEAITVTPLTPELEIKVGDEWYELPHTFDGVVDDNPFKLRFMDTDSYYASGYVDIVYEMDKWDREAPVTGDYTLEVTDGNRVSVTSDYPEFRARVDGLTNWSNNLVFFADVGDTVIEMRFDETANYKQSPVSTTVYEQPKLEALPIDTSTISLTNDELTIVVASIFGENILVRDGSQWRQLPHTLTGAVGDNTIVVKRPETDLYYEGEEVELFIHIDKLFRDAPISEMVNMSNDYKMVTINPVVPDLEMTLDNGVTWQSLPHSFEGVVGDNPFAIRFKETDTYVVSESTEVVYEMGKWDRMSPSIDSNDYTIEEVDGELIITSELSEFVVYHNEEWMNAPVTIPLSLGENSIQVKFNEIDDYLESDVSTYVHIYRIERPFDPESVGITNDELAISVTKLVDDPISVRFGDSGSWISVPTTRNGIVGINRLYFKYMETLEYYESEPHMIEYDVDKLDRPVDVIPVDSEYSVTSDYRTITISQVGGDFDLEAEVNGVWYSLPHSYEGVVGENHFRIRYSEDSMYKPSEYIEDVYIMDKWDRLPPTMSDVNISRESYVLTITSVTADVEILNAETGEWVTSYTFTGEMGINQFSVRFAETDDYKVSGVRVLSYEINLIDRPHEDLDNLNPEDVFDVEVPDTENDDGDRTIIIKVPDDMLILDPETGEWVEGPIEMDVDAPGGVNLTIKFKETDIYNESDPVTLEMTIPKLQNPLVPIPEIINTVSNGKEITVSSDVDGLEVLVDGEWLPLPQVIIGDYGDNNISVRYGETTWMYPSAPIIINQCIVNHNSTCIEEVWRFTNHSNAVYSVAVDDDGYVYSGSWDYTVRKISPTGEEVWSFRHSNRVFAVALDNDGYVYSGSWDNTVRKISPTGQQVWSFTGHSNDVEAVTVDNDGYVYSGSDDRTVRKISPTGQQVWSFGHGGIVSSIAVDNDGYVYSIGNSRLRKISNEGEQMWELFINEGQRVAVDDSGHVYVGTNRFRRLAKLTPNGEEIWSINNIHGRAIVALATDNYGYVYSGSEDNTVKKVSPNGEEIWTFTGHVNNVYGLAIDSDRFVYTGGNDRRIKKIAQLPMTDHPLTPVPENFSVEVQGLNITVDSTVNDTEVLVGSEWLPIPQTFVGAYGHNTVQVRYSGSNCLRPSESIIVNETYIEWDHESSCIEEVWSRSVAGTTTPVNAIMVESDEYMYSHNARHIRKYSMDDGSIIWSFDAGSSITDIKLDGDGHVYVAGEDIRYKLSPEGQPVWEHEPSVTNTVWGSLITLDEPNGCVYVSKGCDVFKLDIHTGVELWHLRDINHFAVIRSIMLHPDGYLYITHSAPIDIGNMRKVTTDGVVVSSITINSNNRLAAVCPSGYIYAGSPQIVSKWDTDGNELWRTTLPYNHDNSLGALEDLSAIYVDEQGYAFVTSGVNRSGTRYGSVRKLSPDGKILWSYGGPHTFATSIDVRNGDIFIGTHDGKANRLTVLPMTDHPLTPVSENFSVEVQGLTFTVDSTVNDTEVLIDGEWLPIPQTFVGVYGHNTVQVRYSGSNCLRPSESIIVDETYIEWDPDNVVAEEAWRFTGHGNWVNAVAVDNDGYVYSNSSDNTVRKISPTGEEVWSFTGHSSNISAVAVDNDGYVYSGSNDNTLRKISPVGEEVWSFTGHSGNVNGVAVDNDGYVYSGSDDRTVRKISPTGQQVWSFTGHSNGVRGVTVDDDGYIYSGSADNTVRKISPTGQQVWSFTGHSNNVGTVSVGNEGYVYSGSEDRTVRKISPTGQQVWSFTGHSDSVWRVAVDNDSYVYSGSRDNTLRKISPTGQQVWSFTGHWNQVRGVAVDNGRYVYSGSADRTVRKIRQIPKE